MQTQTPAFIKSWNCLPLSLCHSWIKHIHQCSQASEPQVGPVSQSLGSLGSADVTPPPRQTLGPEPNLRVVTCPVCDSDRMRRPQRRAEAQTLCSSGEGPDPSPASGGDQQQKSVTPDKPTGERWFDSSSSSSAAVLGDIYLHEWLNPTSFREEKTSFDPSSFDPIDSSCTRQDLYFSSSQVKFCVNLCCDN